MLLRHIPRAPHHCMAASECTMRHTCATDFSLLCHVTFPGRMLNPSRTNTTLSCRTDQHQQPQLRPIRATVCSNRLRILHRNIAQLMHGLGPVCTTQCRGINAKAKASQARMSRPCVIHIHIQPHPHQNPCQAHGRAKKEHGDMQQQTLWHLFYGTMGTHGLGHHTKCLPTQPKPTTQRMEDGLAGCTRCVDNITH